MAGDPQGRRYAPQQRLRLDAIAELAGHSEAPRSARDSMRYSASTGRRLPTRSAPTDKPSWHRLAPQPERQTIRLCAYAQDARGFSTGRARSPESRRAISRAESTSSGSRKVCRASGACRTPGAENGYSGWRRRRRRRVTFRTSRGNAGAPVDCPSSASRRAPAEQAPRPSSGPVGRRGSASRRCRATTPNSPSTTSRSSSLRNSRRPAGRGRTRSVRWCSWTPASLASSCRCVPRWIQGVPRRDVRGKKRGGRTRPVRSSSLSLEAP
jgi:hypothetical protein